VETRRKCPLTAGFSNASFGRLSLLAHAHTYVTVSLADWYLLVYTNGIDPYIAHRAFLLIDEYQAIIKSIGCGPARDEPSHGLRRTGKDACRDRRQAQPGDQCRSRRSQAEGSVRRPGRYVGSSTGFEKLITEETDKWAKVIRAANIKAE